MRLGLLAVLLAVGIACTPEEIEGDDAGECSDGADNDQNGDFDCDDDGCEDSPDCEEEEVDTSVVVDDDPGLSALPDQFSGLSSKAECNGSKPGATAYWGGKLDLSGGSASGTESLFWFPNSAMGGSPCELQYSLSGTTADCASCSVRVTVTANSEWNKGCPDALANGYTDDFTVTYAVTKDGAGGLTMAFESGESYASGFYSGDELTYLSPYACHEY